MRVSSLAAGPLLQQATYFLGFLTWLTTGAALAADGIVNLGRAGSGAELRVHATPRSEWRFESSSNLVHWIPDGQLAALRATGGDGNPFRRLTNLVEAVLFWRAVPSDGLYDPLAVRTLFLTFTNANWQAALTTARTTGKDIRCALVLDNGDAIEAVGARYKGNSSFQMGGSKKSVNLDMDFVDPSGNLMGYSTINLNNAAGDQTIMREPLYFGVMGRYAPCPKAALARLVINGADWGVYSLAQNGDSDLIREWFPSTDGDRWRAPNAGGLAPVGASGIDVPGGASAGPALNAPPGPGGGGGFASPVSALSWQGTNISRYMSYYELKKSNDPTNAWQRLFHAIDVLNNTAAAELRDKVEEVLDVDRWLWFNAVEILFADDDSYWNKGADYSFYWEPESGRIHPVEHDGNEAFISGDASLSPVQGSTGSNRPVISKLLGVPELRQRYLAHLRTALEESFHPDRLVPVIDRFQMLSAAAIAGDTKKGFPMGTYSNSVQSLRSFVTNRYRFLTNHAELRPVPPTIKTVTVPSVIRAGEPVPISVAVGSLDGIDSVWLYSCNGAVGKFSRTQLADDGQHGDGEAGDGVFGGSALGFTAGIQARLYVEARSGNATKTAVFWPARAEAGAAVLKVDVGAPRVSGVVINELMANNTGVIRDPQGDSDDWIELANRSNVEMDLGGLYLTDDPEKPRKWRIPQETRIAAGGYLLVWADEDVDAAEGLHANFKLASSGEQVWLVDSDANGNALLDAVTFGAQLGGTSFGRLAARPGDFVSMTPTPGKPNR